MTAWPCVLRLNDCYRRVVRDGSVTRIENNPWVIAGVGFRVLPLGVLLLFVAADLAWDVEVVGSPSFVGFLVVGLFFALPATMGMALLWAWADLALKSQLFVEFDSASRIVRLRAKGLWKESLLEEFPFSRLLRFHAQEEKRDSGEDSAVYSRWSLVLDDESEREVVDQPPSRLDDRLMELARTLDVEVRRSSNVRRSRWLGRK